MAEGYFYEPADIEAAEALRRKRAYANALMTNDVPQGAYGGLAAAGSRIAGALLARNSDRDMSQLGADMSKRQADAWAAILKGESPSAVPSQPSQVDENGAPIPSAPAPQTNGSLADRVLASGNAGLIGQLAPSLVQNQMKRDNAVFENDLPLARSKREEAQLDLDTRTALEKVKNGLPMTAQEEAALKIQQGNLGVRQSELALDREKFNFSKTQPKAQASTMKLGTVLRKEFDAQPDVKQFNDVANSYDIISDVSKKPASAQNDLSLIFSYMKMLDPGSVVREGEFANAQNTAGVPDQIRNLYNRARTGERLNNDQRKGFASSARDVYEARKRRYGQLVTQYKGYAKDNNLPDDTIQERMAAGGSAPAAPSVSNW